MDILTFIYSLLELISIDIFAFGLLYVLYKYLDYKYFNSIDIDKMLDRNL